MVAMEEYLSNIATQKPALAGAVAQLRDFYSRKLWHQLYLAVDSFVKNPEGPKGNDLVYFYEHFVKDFQTKLSALKFAEFVVFISRQLENAKALEFLDKAKDVVAKDSESTLYCKAEMTRLRLHQNVPIQEVKDAMEEVGAAIDAAAEVDNVVHSIYYYLVSQYYQREYSARDFFKNSLLYLAYTPADSIPEADKVKISFDVAVAALLGEGIYNFGELMGNVVFKSLDATHGWLSSLLTAFNSGDVAQYERLIKAHEGEIAMQASSFLDSKPALREKISIMSLIELVFRRASHERVLSFAEIAKAAQIPMDEVELIVMKAMSRKLVRGTIDETSKTVNFTWVQPRVLDRTQVEHMKDKLGDWMSQVHNMTTFLENETPELFV